MKPCISVSYTVAVDTFYPTTATELSEMLGAASTSTLQIQFSRTVKYETVRVTCKPILYAKLNLQFCRRTTS